MRQIIPKTNFGHRLKLWTRADLSSVSSLHDKSSWNKPTKGWEYQSRNPLKNHINPNGTWVGWKVRALLRILEQAHKRNARPRTLSDLWKNGRVPVRVEKNPRFPGVYQIINDHRLGFRLSTIPDQESQPNPNYTPHQTILLILTSWFSRSTLSSLGIVLGNSVVYWRNKTKQNKSKKASLGVCPS